MAGKGNGERVLGPVARLLRKGFERKGVALTDRLNTVLARIESGEAEAFRDLSVALLEGYVRVSDITSPLFAPEFFARDTATVARELCGSTFVYTGSGASNVWSGPVTGVAAYGRSSQFERYKETAEAEPGTVGLFISRSTKVAIVSAHAPGEVGVVSIWGVGKFNMGDTCAGLGIEGYIGKVVGRDASLYLEPRDTSNDRVGTLRVKKITDPSEKRTSLAAYKLVES